MIVIGMMIERKGVGAKTVKRLEVWAVDLGKREGSVQSGIRPLLIVSNNIGNHHAPVVMGAPLTTKLKKRTMPTHVFVNADDCEVFEDSVVMFEQIFTVDKRNLRDKLFELPSTYIEKVNKAMMVSLELA